MNKYTIEGETAVLYSPGYGAGWSTWNDKAMALDGDIAKALHEDGIDAAKTIAIEKYPDAYMGGFNDIKIEWVPAGHAFEVVEYDGSESVNIISYGDYLTA